MGSSILDFNNEMQRELQALFNIVKLRKGACLAWEQSRIMDLVKQYDVELVEAVLTNAMDMQWLNVTHWFVLAPIFKLYGIERTTWAIHRVAGRQNFSIDTAEGILKQEIAAYRKPQGGKGSEDGTVDQRVKQVQQRQLLYPTANGLHTERTATTWLRDVKHVGVEHWPEFFDACGTDEVVKTMKLYQLKAEYR